MKKKFLIGGVIIVVLIIVIVIIWVVARKPASQNQTGMANLGSTVQNQTSKLTDNYFKCDIGGKSIDFVLESVDFYSKLNATYLTGRKVGSDIYSSINTISLFFAGQKVGDQNNIGKESFELNVNATYQDEKAQTWNTNDDNDSAVASITRYSGNNIEGTFSANPALMRPDGQDKNSRFSMKCSFKCSLSIKSQ